MNKQLNFDFNAIPDKFPGNFPSNSATYIRDESKLPECSSSPPFVPYTAVEDFTPSEEDHFASTNIGISSQSISNHQVHHSRLKKTIRDDSTKQGRGGRKVNKKRTSSELDEDYTLTTIKLSPEDSLEENSTDNNSEMVKNYIPIVTNVFSQKIVDKDNITMQEMILSAVIRSGTIDINEVKEKLLDYVTKYILGKTDYTSMDEKSSRQYKIRSKTQMKKVFQPTAGDSQDILNIKSILRILIEAFLNSEVYLNWIQIEYLTKKKKNKSFLADKTIRTEMIKVFIKDRYRPKFNLKANSN